jgi:hypothetical protein
LAVSWRVRPMMGRAVGVMRVGGVSRRVHLAQRRAIRKRTRLRVLAMGDRWSVRAKIGLEMIGGNGRRGGMIGGRGAMIGRGMIVGREDRDLINARSSVAIRGRRLGARTSLIRWMI